jgi:Ni/Co efflux regulator RcnB
MVRFGHEARCVHHPATTLPTNCVASREAPYKGEVFMLKVLVPATIVSILAATSASAGPVASSLLQLKSIMPADTMQAVDRDGNRERRRAHRQGRHQSYTPGQRYDRAPSHYRRHAHRPHNWQSRGCILVGPIWYCA